MNQNQKAESRILPTIATISLILIGACLAWEIFDGRWQTARIELFLLLGLFLYFLPWLSAIERDSPQRTAIGLTNLFFGWSLLGWVIALIWSAKRYDFK